MWTHIPHCIIFTIIGIQASNDVVPELERKVDKSGYHRDLSTTIQIPDKLLPEPDGDVICYMMFIETIPSGAYVDPYQLNSLIPFGGPDVLILSPIDVEKPAFQSEDLTCYVFTNISYIGGVWKTQYTLPIHLRYHAISDESDFADVTFKSPRVAVRCRIIEYGMQYFGYKGTAEKQENLPCTSENRVLCEWTFITAKLSADKLTVQVPVGRKEHYLLVTIATIVITVSGCVTLTIKALNSKQIKGTKVS